MEQGLRYFFYRVYEQGERNAQLQSKPSFEKGEKDFLKRTAAGHMAGIQRGPGGQGQPTLWRARAAQGNAQACTCTGAGAACPRLPAAARGSAPTSLSSPPCRPRLAGSTRRGFSCSRPVVPRRANCVLLRHRQWPV